MLYGSAAFVASEEAMVSHLFLFGVILEVFLSMILPGLSLLKDCVLALYPEVVLNSILQPISTLRGHLRTRHSLHSPHSARAAPFKQWSEDDLQSKAVGDG